MENHRKFNNSELISMINDCTLAPSNFTHEAHLRLAWIYLNNYELHEAIEHVNDLIFRYVAFLGAANKYNKTLTTAAIYMVFHFMNKSRFNTFEDFIAEFPRLKYNFKDLMACHYGFDIYNSENAKKEFLAPDLLPFS